METAELDEVFLSLSTMPDAHRGIDHEVVGDMNWTEGTLGRCRLVVRRKQHIPLRDYQGNATIRAQASLHDGRVVCLSGGQVVGRYASDTDTVLLDLRGKVTVILPPGLAKSGE